MNFNKHNKHIFFDNLDQNDEQEEKIHQGIECDGCGMNPIRGPRFKCLDCPDYDICEDCYSKETHNEHNMQRISIKGKSKAFLYERCCLSTLYTKRYLIFQMIR